MTTADVIDRLEGRKRALLLGEHYTSEPLSKDHREDILRWVYDIDEAITALKVGSGNEATQAERAATTRRSGAP